MAGYVTVNSGQGRHGTSIHDFRLNIRKYSWILWDF